VRLLIVRRSKTIQFVCRFRFIVLTIAAEQYRYLGACALNFTHREYIGTGSKRGQPVPGVKKVTLRLKVSELGLTAGGRKYLAALVGPRYNERLDELKLTEDLYPAVEGTCASFSCRVATADYRV